MEELLKLFKQFSVLVKHAFEDDTRFLTSRDKVTMGNMGTNVMGEHGDKCDGRTWGLV